MERQSHSKNIRPAKSISQLEARDQTPNRWYKFSLFRLIIFSNVAGLLVAVLVITRGSAISYGILVGFLLPMIIFFYIGLLALKEQFWGRPKRPFKTVASIKISKHSPFEE